MIELLLTTFAYLGTVQITLTETPPVATEVGGRQHETQAKATADGRIEGTRSALGASWGERLNDDEITKNVVHEMLHLADLRDDGAYNGSLLPYPPTADDPAHELVYWAMRNPDTAAVKIRGMRRRAALEAEG